MPPLIILSYTDEGGEPRRAEVCKSGFTIGRGADSDLRIADTNLSRRHALIEILGGKPYISDCGSSNGTTVNGQPLTTAMELCDGDVINLGNSCELKVSGVGVGDQTVAFAPVNTAAAPPEGEGGTQPRAPAAPAAAGADGAGVAPAPASSLGAPVIAGGAIAVILLVALVAFFLSLGKGDEKRRPGADGRADPVALEGEDTDTSAHKASADAVSARAAAPRAGEPAPETKGEATVTAGAEGQSAAGGSRSADGEEQIGRAVRRVMSRVSTDDAPYISDEGVKDVASRVREYRGSAALAERLRAMSRACPEVTALSRSNNLKPSLLVYAAIAQSEGGGDPAAVARQMAPKLLTLRATFGTETANSTLLLVAAYPYPFNPSIGSQERTPHPLASKLQEVGGKRSVVDLSVARSVWFLHEKGAVTPEAYNLVVRLLAVGVIAQDPRRYGVEADPLFC